MFKYVEKKVNLNSKEVEEVNYLITNNSLFSITILKRKYDDVNTMMLLKKYGRCHCDCAAKV